MSATGRALLRSQSGRCSGRHLALVPVSHESTYSNERFRTLLLRRARQPLDITSSRCNGPSCGANLDPHGDHRAACSRAGRLVRRAAPVERMWARVCREGGARVQTNAFLRDLNLLRDGRQLRQAGLSQRRLQRPRPGCCSARGVVVQQLPPCVWGERVHLHPDDEPVEQRRQLRAELALVEGARRGHDARAGRGLPRPGMVDRRGEQLQQHVEQGGACLLYTSPSPRDA